MTGLAPAVAASPLTATDEAAEPAPDRCEVCGHVLSAHDRVATRFCAATLHSALTRGCLCR